MKFSAILITLNEEKNIRRCLESLKEVCDDILLVDSGSTDSTVEIAESYGVRTLRRDFDNFANQRNYVIDTQKVEYDWVLHLDADEVLTPEFREVISSLIPPDNIDAYQVPSKLMFFGKWLKFSAAYPVYQVRLGRKTKLRFEQVGHGQRETVSSEKIAFFSEPYEHYSFSHGIQRWLQKHINYARDEAELIGSGSKVFESSENINQVQKRRTLKEKFLQLPVFVRPVGRFAYHIVFCRGFLDGRRGLIYATMMMTYEIMIMLFYYEKKRKI